MSIDIKKVGNQIAVLRKSKNLNQSELGKCSSNNCRQYFKRRRKNYEL